jgi:hypothetical protein
VSGLEPLWTVVRDCAERVEADERADGEDTMSNRRRLLISFVFSARANAVSCVTSMVAMRLEA